MKKLLTLLWLGIFSHLAAFTQIPDDLGIFDGNKASLDVMPSFQGGDLDTFRKWVSANVVYPQLALENQALTKCSLELMSSLKREA